MNRYKIHVRTDADSHSPAYRIRVNWLWRYASHERIRKRVLKDYRKYEPPVGRNLTATVVKTATGHSNERRVVTVYNKVVIMLDDSMIP